MIDETTAGRRSVCLIPIRLTCPTLLCIYAIGQLPWSSAWLRMTLQNAREAVWRPRSSKTAKNCLRPLQALHGALRASIPHVGRVSRSRERCLRPSEHRRVPRAAPKNRIASALDGFYPHEQSRLTAAECGAHDTQRSGRWPHRRRTDRPGPQRQRQGEMERWLIEPDRFVWDW